MSKSTLMQLVNEVRKLLKDAGYYEESVVYASEPIGMIRAAIYEHPRCGQAVIEVHADAGAVDLWVDGFQFWICDDEVLREAREWLLKRMGSCEERAEFLYKMDLCTKVVACIYMSGKKYFEVERFKVRVLGFEDGAVSLVVEGLGVGETRVWVAGDGRVVVEPRRPYNLVAAFLGAVEGRCVDLI